MLTPELDPSEKLENIFLPQHLLVNIERQNPLNCFQLGSSKKGRSFFTALWNFEVTSPGKGEHRLLWRRLGRHTDGDRSRGVGRGRMGGGVAFRLVLHYNLGRQTRYLDHCTVV